MTTPPEPTLGDLEDKLMALLVGTATREEVADWARPWVTEEYGPVRHPEVVWDVLGWSGAADVIVAPDEYLYSEPDFHAWLDVVQNAMEDRR